MDKAYTLHKMNFQWSRLCEMVEIMRPKTIVKTVIWNKPQEGLIKFNTDGSYFKQSGKAGIGGMARDNSGKFIFAFVVPIDARDHNIAEAMAAKYAVEWLLHQGYEKGIVELDSLLIVKMMQNEVTNSLNLSSIVDDTTELISSSDISFAHCFHGANNVADCLAKLASTLQEPALFHMFEQFTRRRQTLLCCGYADA